VRRVSSTEGTDDFFLEASRLLIPFIQPARLPLGGVLVAFMGANGRRFGSTQGRVRAMTTVILSIPPRKFARVEGSGRHSWGGNWRRTHQAPHPRLDRKDHPNRAVKHPPARWGAALRCRPRCWGRDRRLRVITLRGTDLVRLLGREVVSPDQLPGRLWSNESWSIRPPRIRLDP